MGVPELSSQGRVVIQQARNASFVVSLAYPDTPSPPVTPASLRGSDGSRWTVLSRSIVRRSHPDSGWLAVIHIEPYEPNGRTLLEAWERGVDAASLEGMVLDPVEP